MRYTSEQERALLFDLAASEKRVAELDKAYQKLLKHTEERETDIKNVMFKLFNHGQQGCLDFVSIEDALRSLNITL